MKIKLLGRDEFAVWATKLKRAEQTNDAPDATLLWKAGDSLVKSVDPETLTVDFIISDGEVDRDRDTINPDGWDLRNYKKNPVVLWAHMSWEVPIAQTLAIGVENGKLITKAQFTPREVNPFGFMIFQMYNGRYMRATSVGFKPTKWEFVGEEDAARRGGINFMKQELLEYSAVPIPANPRALMRAHEDGIDLEPLKDFSCRVLDLNPAKIKCIDVHEFERTWKTLSSHPLVLEVVGLDPADPEKVHACTCDLSKGECACAEKTEEPEDGEGDSDEGVPGDVTIAALALAQMGEMLKAHVDAGLSALREEFTAKLDSKSFVINFEKRVEKADPTDEEMEAIEASLVSDVDELIGDILASDDPDAALDAEVEALLSDEVYDDEDHETMRGLMRSLVDDAKKRITEESGRRQAAAGGASDGGDK